MALTTELATLDALLLIKELKRESNATEQDIHTFAYLACLLWLYSGRPVGSWEYAFVMGRNGTPHAPALHQAVEDGLRRGLVQTDELYLQLTSNGERFTNSLSQSLHSRKHRNQCIASACRTLIGNSPENVSVALGREPNLHAALAANDGRALLSGPTLRVLHEQLKALSEGMGIQIENLALPAMVWISFLNSLPNDEPRN
jgi:hypothetical protein